MVAPGCVSGLRLTVGHLQDTKHTVKFTLVVVYSKRNRCIRRFGQQELPLRVPTLGFPLCTEFMYQR